MSKMYFSKLQSSKKSLFGWTEKNYKTWNFKNKIVNKNVIKM